MVMVCAVCDADADPPVMIEGYSLCRSCLRKVGPTQWLTEWRKRAREA